MIRRLVIREEPPSVKSIITERTKPLERLVCTVGIESPTRLSNCGRDRLGHGGERKEIFLFFERPPPAGGDTVSFPFRHPPDCDWWRRRCHQMVIARDRPRSAWRSKVAQNIRLRHRKKRQSSKRKWSDTAFLILVSHVRFHFPNSVGSLWLPGGPDTPQP